MPLGRAAEPRTTPAQVTDTSPVEERLSVAHWLALFVLVFCTRIPFLLSTEQDIDGARFVAGVSVFSVARLHPHPPGYPVYMGPAIALQRLTHCSAQIALSLVAAFGFALTIVSVISVARAFQWKHTTALTAALLAALSTGLSVLSVRALSDSLGIGLAWFTLAAALHQREDRSTLTPTFIGAVLTMGVRWSLVPLVGPACLWVLWRNRTDRRAIATTSLLASIAAGLCWIPVFVSQGFFQWFGALRLHAQGHFEAFGGTIVTEPNALARLQATIFHLWTQSLSGAWSDRSLTLIVSSGTIVAMATAGLVQAIRSRSTRTNGMGPESVLFICCISYFAWVFFGQNVLWAPRHWMALTPAIMLLLARLIARIGAAKRQALVLAFIALPFAAESYRVLSVQARSDPPALCLLKKMPQRGRETLVASGQLGQWFRQRNPGQRVLNFSTAALAQSIARQNRWQLLATSELTGISSLPGARPTNIACRGDRYIWPAMYELEWWSVGAP